MMGSDTYFFAPQKQQNQVLAKFTFLIVSSKLALGLDPQAKVTCISVSLGACSIAFLLVTTQKRLAIQGPL